MKRENVIVIGAGGHAKVVADIILRSGDRITGFLDGARRSGEFFGYPILGSDSEYRKFPGCSFIIAIGNAQARERIAQSMPGAAWYTAVHPGAVISPLDTRIGEGTVIMADAVINPGAHIGRHCILNSGSIVEHDNRIGDYAHISVGAKVAGTVRIGEKTWVGAGATVSNGVSVCGGCMLGAGAVVVRDITEAGTYVGVPARKIK